MKHSRLAGLVVLAVLVLTAVAGCSPASSDVETTPEPQVFDDSIPRDESGQILTPRDRLEMIGKTHPGFGGYSVDGSVVTVLMTDVEDIRTAERAAVAVMEDRPPEMRVISEVRVARADFLFTDLAEWYWQISQRVFIQFVGVISSGGIDEQTNRIEIGITDLSARENVLRSIDELGVPLEAVEIEEGTAEFLGTN